MNTRLSLLILAAVFWVVIARAGSQEAVGTNCSTCHDQPKKMAGTAHASLSCSTCHPKHEKVPHPSGIPKPACASCHQDVAARNRLGVHGRARAQGNAAAPDCGVCHGDVHEVQRTGTEAFRKSIPELCGDCHDKVFAEYEESVHGKAVAQGIVQAPVCTSCHGEHQIQPPTSSASPVSPSHIPETCGRCHGDVRLTQRFNLPVDRIVSFEASFHGLALKAGSETVANCATCHGVHNILPSSDARSTINPKNLPKTCGQCHPGAGSRFAIARIHWTEGRSEPTPVRWVRVAYGILIPLLIGGMLLHSLGDWVHKVFQLRLKPARTAVPAWPVASVVATRGPASFRMYRFERIQHGLLILTFTTLAWSGFALKYPDQWWAKPLISWETGWQVRGTVHRIAGAVFIGLCVTHLVSLFADRTLRRHWKTLWPRRADVAEAIGNFAYILGLWRQPPKISFHSYVEKAEYWAVVWGAVVMAATGAMLWATTFILNWLPKVTLDAAITIHFYEALLATLAVIVWHFYTVILDPDVYPMDPAWLTGYSVRKRELEEEEKETH